MWQGYTEHRLDRPLELRRRQRPGLAAGEVACSRVGRQRLPGARLAGQGVHARGDNRPNQFSRVAAGAPELPHQGVEQRAVDRRVAQPMVVRRVDEVFADENAEEPVGHVAAELVVAAVENAPHQRVAGRRRGRAKPEQRRLNRLAGAGQEQLAGHHAAAGVRSRVGEVGREGEMLALLPAIHRVVVAPCAAEAQAQQRAADVLGAVARVVVAGDESRRLAAAENVAGQLRQRLVLANRLEQVSAQFRVLRFLEILLAAGLG